MNPFAEVLSRFDKVRAVESRPLTWKAVCPAHEDRNPSLTLWVGEKGWLMIRCWRKPGCPLSDILAAKGLTMRDLFPHDNDRDQRPATFEQPRRRMVATYDYRDEQGILLYQVLRFDPKSFAQRRPGPGAGWTWGLGDCRRVLYRLPDLLAQPAAPVVVVEGEGKVEALRSLGLVATCNPGGTGMSWADGYSESLRGRRVAVLPDNDRAGREHADTVAGSLIRHGAASVRMVQLPGLPERGDVVDWLKTGHRREDLLAIIRAVPEWGPRQAVSA